MKSLFDLCFDKIDLFIKSKYLLDCNSSNNNNNDDTFEESIDQDDRMKIKDNEIDRNLEQVVNRNTLNTPLLKLYGLSRSLNTNNHNHNNTKNENEDRIKFFNEILKIYIKRGVLNIDLLYNLSLSLPFHFITRLDLKNITSNYHCYNISKIKTIRYLNLSNSNHLGNKGIKYLCKLPKLVELDISNCNKLTNQSLKSISSMPRIELLNISNNSNFDDHALPHLFGNYTLVEIIAKKVNFTDDCLKEIDIGFNKFQDGLSAQEPFTNLQRLNLTDTFISGKSLSTFLQFKSLEHLYIQGTKCTFDQLIKFEKSAFSTCKINSTSFSIKFISNNNGTNSSNSESKLKKDQKLKGNNKFWPIDEITKFIIENKKSTSTALSTSTSSLNTSNTSLDTSLNTSLNTSLDTSLDSYETAHDSLNISGDYDLLNVSNISDQNNNNNNSKTNTSRDSDILFEDEDNEDYYEDDDEDEEDEEMKTPTKLSSILQSPKKKSNNGNKQKSTFKWPDFYSPIYTESNNDDNSNNSINEDTNTNNNNDGELILLKDPFSNTPTKRHQSIIYTSPSHLNIHYKVSKTKSLKSLAPMPSPLHINQRFLTSSSNILSTTIKNTHHTILSPYSKSHVAFSPKKSISMIDRKRLNNSISKFVNSNGYITSPTPLISPKSAHKHDFSVYNNKNNNYSDDEEDDDEEEKDQEIVSNSPTLSKKSKHAYISTPTKSKKRKSLPSLVAKDHHHDSNIKIGKRLSFD